jgi:hypothetical protein
VTGDYLHHFCPNSETAIFRSQIDTVQMQIFRRTPGGKVPGTGCVPGDYAIDLRHEAPETRRLCKNSTLQVFALFLRRKVSLFIPQPASELILNSLHRSRREIRGSDHALALVDVATGVAADQEQPLIGIKVTEEKVPYEVVTKIPVR